jgi:UDP-GlcNAc:undecaprenyl-phosphate GlcNAc-1-phosphate transferase
VRAALSVTAGLLVGRAVWVAMRPVFDAPLLLRTNFRGEAVATAAGVVLPVTVLLVESARSVLSVAGVGESLSAERAQWMVLIAALGFGLLGLVDDLLGSGEARGFRGHLRAAARGRLTTGGLKLAGGAAVAVAVVAPLEGDRVVRLVVDAGVVALCANLGNLFDRAPGRTTKGAVLAFFALAIVSGDHVALGSVAVVVGAALALLVDELREQLMLGDVGANVLGAVVGLGVVMVTAPVTRGVVLVIVVVLNVLSEVVSFSDVIARLPLLRAIDQLGRRSR